MLLVCQARTQVTAGIMPPSGVLCLLTRLFHDISGGPTRKKTSARDHRSNSTPVHPISTEPLRYILNLTNFPLLLLHYSEPEHPALRYYAAAVSDRLEGQKQRYDRQHSPARIFGADSGCLSPANAEPIRSTGERPTADTPSVAGCTSQCTPLRFLPTLPTVHQIDMPMDTQRRPWVVGGHHGTTGERG